MQCIKQNNNYICFCTVHEYFSKSYYLLFEFVAIEIQRLKQGLCILFNTFFGLCRISCKQLYLAINKRQIAIHN